MYVCVCYAMMEIKLSRSQYFLHTVLVSLMMLETKLTTGAVSRQHIGPDAGVMELLFDDVSHVNDVIPQCSSHRKPVNVSLDLSLRGILDVDEPSQVVTAALWLRWYWNDCRLVWDEEEHNIKSLVVPMKKIWIPDITLYDSSVGGTFEGISEFCPTLQSSGDVMLMAPAVVTFTCKMDITYFPLDRQVCRLKFASWSYSGADIELHPISLLANTENYANNGEWHLIGMPARRFEETYPCCVELYPSVSYFMIFRRQHLYYFFNLIMPCSLITIISILVFYLPPESGEKMSLGVTVLLSLCVFLLMVSERMPATSETVPLIARYFAATIILVTCSCLLTIFTLHVHHRGAGGMEVPRWVRIIVLSGLGRLIYCQKMEENDGEMNKRRQSYYSLAQEEASQTNLERVFTCVRKRNGFRKKEENGSPTNNEDKPTIQMIKLLEEQLRYLKIFSLSFTAYENDVHVSLEWRRVAMVLDRLFLYIIAMVTVVVTSMILFHRPAYTNDLTDDEIEDIINSHRY